MSPIPVCRSAGGVPEMSTNAVLCPALCIFCARISPSSRFADSPMSRSEKTTLKGFSFSMADSYFAKASLPFSAVTMFSWVNPSLSAVRIANLRLKLESSAISIRGFCSRKDVDKRVELSTWSD